MINKPPFCKGLDIRMPILIPIKGRGFIKGLGSKEAAATLLPELALNWVILVEVCSPEC